MMNLLKLAACAAPAFFLASPVFAQQSEWKRYDAIQVEGVERLPDLGESTIRASAAKGLFAFQTNRGVEGWLNGLPRHEIRAPASVLTWLDSTPGWALQLPRPSLPEAAKIFQPVRASRKELLGDRRALERQFGQSLRDLGQETYCGRPCQVLEVQKNATPGAQAKQKLWIDLETGLILRRDENEKAGGDYAYRLKSFTPNATLDPALFQIPADAKTIRGLVNPEILRHVPETHTPADYASDMQKTRKASKIGTGNWVRGIGMAPGFDYIQTVTQERGGANTPTTNLTKEQKELVERIDKLLASDFPLTDMDGANQPQVRVFTEDTDGNHTIRRVSVISNTPLADDVDSALQFARVVINSDVEAEGAGQIQGQIVIKTLDDMNLEGATPQVYVFRGAFNPSDNLILDGEMPSMLQFKDAMRAGLPAANTVNTANACIESDFLDRKTGDTVAFYQLYNRKWTSILRDMQTQTGPKLTSAKFGDVQAYAASSPFALNLIVWRMGTTEYVLASTRLTAAELLALAETPAPAAPK